MATDERLRREIDDLGRAFGDTVRRFAGEETFQLVEQVRRLARRFCDGDEGAADEIDTLLRDLSGEQLRLVMRSFGTFLELANLAEDRQRVRSLRDRERHHDVRRESIHDAVQQLKEQGLSAADFQVALERVGIELVFTAHPTEAKRKSIRAKLRVLRRLLSRLDVQELTPREEDRLRKLVRGEIIKLWQTDVLRPDRPTVLEEVRRGLSFSPVLWHTVPRILSEVRSAATEVYPDQPLRIPSLLSFGSWMGGDRDGHPHVTPEVTQKTIDWLREAAIKQHQEIGNQLIESLSISIRQAQGCSQLYEPIAEACAKYPELEVLLDRIAPLETPRRWLRIVVWRLEQTARVTIKEAGPSGAYADADELLADVDRLREVLEATGDQEVVSAEVQAWIDQIRVFGLHTARLDLRQHSELYSGVMEELWQAIGLLQADEKLTEERRCDLLESSLSIATSISPIDLSPESEETLDLFRVLRRSARRFGMECLGGHVISMTQKPSDLLTVLWLWKWSERVDGGSPKDEGLHLPIIPLFETIIDLENACQILGDALNREAYRKHVVACKDRQTVMIGYSDSTKDGGYLSAAWALQRVQIDLHRLAKKHGVHLTYFHGRGGSLGRGGGPAARSILSLPSGTFDGSLRLTEQGEVLAERYDDPAIAHRHLEQVLRAVLIAATTTPSNEKELAKPAKLWHGRMQEMADASFKAYRELVDHPNFTQFFRLVTPIREIEALPIGSRPAKRKKGDRIEDLRAIPWVFSWTQCRCLMPAWYGLGQGLSRLAETQDGTNELREMYGSWLFFRATIDNAVLALAKSNGPVFNRYALMAGDAPELREVAQLLDEEYHRATKVVLAATGRQELLDGTSWLKESIKLRNRYVDPLNLIQLEVIRRVREAEGAGEEVPSELRILSQLAIKGLAAGMRTTG